MFVQASAVGYNQAGSVANRTSTWWALIVLGDWIGRSAVQRLTG